MTDYQTLLLAADHAEETARDRRQAATSMVDTRRWRRLEQQAGEFATWLMLSRKFNPQAR